MGSRDPFRRPPPAPKCPHCERPMERHYGLWRTYGMQFGCYNRDCNWWACMSCGVFGYPGGRMIPLVVGGMKQ